MAVFKLGDWDVEISVNNIVVDTQRGCRTLKLGIGTGG